MGREPAVTFSLTSAWGPWSASTTTIERTPRQAGVAAHLFLWGERNGYKYVINSFNGWILQKDGHRSEIASTGSEEPLKRFFTVVTPEYCDLDGVDEEPLFDRAVEKLGALGHDEVFAFEPALVAGGTQKLEAIARRNIHVHLSVLAQFGHREFLDRHSLAGKAFG